MSTYTGQRFGNYRLIKLLDEGGFAEVYLGEHIHLATSAAVKVLTTELTEDKIEQFRDEARIMIGLKHPNIMRVLEFGLEGRIPFIVMEYASKGSLHSIHPKGSCLPLPTIITYVKQVAAALQYIHDQKLVHRDIKPRNMLLGDQNEVLLSDFGIFAAAHSTRSLKTQDRPGTIYYMSPEQIQGKPRLVSDQYSLGVVVYEWICGTCPFRGTLPEIIAQHLSTPPPPFKKELCVPIAVEEVVMKALEKDPKNRFASVQDFAIALERAVPSTTPSQEPSNDALPQKPSPHSHSATTEPNFSSKQFNSVEDVAAIVEQAAKPAAPSRATIPQVLAKTQASSLMGHLPESRAVRQQRDEAERYMLQQVKRLWIAGVLDHSLHREAARVLAASHPAGAVGVGIFPRNLILEGPNGQRSPLSSDTSIIQVYDEAGGDLLIVGQSGVGKTTLLLELARALIKRAESDPTHPLPIVLSLVSWATKQLSIEAWLIEEIHAWYPKSYGYAEQWIKHNQLHPLFDGLDEIPDEKRAACVNALAVYWRDHPGIPMVICSQRAQTLTRVGNFPFKRVISVHPPSFGQIDHYLDNVGTSLQSLREVLRAETALQAIASYPFMLCLLILTYHLTIRLNLDAISQFW